MVNLNVKNYKTKQLNSKLIPVSRNYQKSKTAWNLSLTKTKHYQRKLAENVHSSNYWKSHEH